MAASASSSSSDASEKGAETAAEAATEADTDTVPGAYVDTHCHVDEVLQQLHIFPPYENTAVARAFGPLCQGVVAQFCDPAAFSPSFAMYPELLKLPGVYGAFGLHPHHAKHWDDALADRIKEALGHERAVAYGEIGLDYRAMRSPKDVQQACFVAQLAVWQGLIRSLPLVLHCSQAEDDMLRLLLENTPASARSSLRFHLHCFTGGAKHAAAFLDAFPNLYVGVTGFVTYEKAKALQQALRSGAIPLTRLLLETDGPHMRPEEGSGEGRGRGRGRGGHGGGEGRGGGRGGGRGKRRGHGGRAPTTPASIPAIAAAVAALVGQTPDDVLRQTLTNARTLYGI